MRLSDVWANSKFTWRQTRQIMCREVVCITNQVQNNTLHFGFAMWIKRFTHPTQVNMRDTVGFMWTKISHSAGDSVSSPSLILHMQIRSGRQMSLQESCFEIKGASTWVFWLWMCVTLVSGVQQVSALTDLSVNVKTTDGQRRQRVMRVNACDTCDLSPQSHQQINPDITPAKKHSGESKCVSPNLQGGTICNMTKILVAHFEMFYWWNQPPPFDRCINTEALERLTDVALVFGNNDHRL